MAFDTIIPPDWSCSSKRASSALGLRPASTRFTILADDEALWLGNESCHLLLLLWLLLVAVPWLLRKLADDLLPLRSENLLAKSCSASREMPVKRGRRVGRQALTTAMEASMTVQ